MSAEDRLRWYARFFDCVEVNSTYYALPSPRNAALWVERTPPGFQFHVKAYSLMTGHHPRLDTLPAELRVMLPEDAPLRRRGELDRDQFPPEALDLCFALFRAALEPLVAAGKLGYVLFQLAPWVRYDEATLAYLASLPARLPGWPLAVEFRNETWIPERTDEVGRVPPAARAGPRHRGRGVAAVGGGGDDGRVGHPPAPRAEPPGLARPAGRARADGRREVRLPLRRRGAGRDGRAGAASPPERPASRGHVQQQQRGLPHAERARPQTPPRPRRAGPRGDAGRRGGPGRRRRGGRAIGPSADLWDDSRAGSQP